MRLFARYQKFWPGFRYRNFWAAYSVRATGAGSTVTSTVSLTSGAVTTDALVGAQVVSASVTLIPGSTSTDATAPLNTRLNAHYRHFWGRKRTERHFWAQYEGAGIGPAFADGQLVVSSLAVIVNGDVSGDANQDGVTLTIDTELIDGIVELVHGGQVLEVDLSLVDGEPAGDANVDGQTLAVAVSLISGFASVQVPGQTLTATVSIANSGTATGTANFGGATVPIVLSIVNGAASGDANVDGEALQVDVSIIAGEAIVPPNVLAIGEPLDPIEVTLIAGAAQSDSSVGGAVLPVTVTLIPGVATASSTAPGAVITVPVTIVPGEALGDGGEVRVHRSGGGVRTERARPVDAQAHGQTISMGTGFALVGRASVTYPLVELVEVDKPTVVYEPPVIVIGEDSAPATVPGFDFRVLLTLVPGVAMGEARAEGAVLDAELVDPDEALWEVACGD